MPTFGRLPKLASQLVSPTSPPHRTATADGRLKFHDLQATLRDGQHLVATARHLEQSMRLNPRTKNIDEWALASDRPPPQRVQLAGIPVYISALLPDVQDITSLLAILEAQEKTPGQGVFKEATRLLGRTDGSPLSTRLVRPYDPQGPVIACIGHSSSLRHLRGPQLDSLLREVSRQTELAASELASTFAYLHPQFPPDAGRALTLQLLQSVGERGYKGAISPALPGIVPGSQESGNGHELEPSFTVKGPGLVAVSTEIRPTLEAARRADQRPAHDPSPPNGDGITLFEFMDPTYRASVPGYTEYLARQAAAPRPKSVDRSADGASPGASTSRKSSGLQAPM